MSQVNNAGVNFNTGADNSVESAEEVIATNYFGTKRMIKAMIPIMKPSPFGARILNVSSRLGRVNGRRNVSTPSSNSYYKHAYIRINLHIPICSIRTYIHAMFVYFICWYICMFHILN